MQHSIIQQESVTLSTTTIQYLHNYSDDNQAKPFMLMLHGFPENSWSYSYYLSSLYTEYRVIAPDLPGYNLSPGFSTVSDYNIENLMVCLDEFIEAICQDNKVYLVGHDWGGAIAWPFAAFYQHRIHKLVILNSAHPSAFTREMAQNEKQQKRSDYITDLISDGAYDWVKADDFYRLKRLYGGLFETFDVEYRKQLLAQWQHKTSMDNAFAYYKNMPNLITKRVEGNADIKIPNIRVDLPTLVLWGVKDTAFVPQVLNNLEQWVKDLTLVEYQQADHWLHLQQPEAVLKKIRNYC